MEPKPSTKNVRRIELRIATVCGMDSETRAALGSLETLARSGSVAVAGCFMPDPMIRTRLAGWEVSEEVAEVDFFRFRRIVVPYSGIQPHRRKAWDDERFAVTDLSSPHVRRAQVALGLLRLEGAQALVIGRHDDPETRALAGTSPGTRVIQDTTDTARLAFSPAFGVVNQTTLSPRRTSWLYQQLQMRYRDARVTFLNTTTPAMLAREQALEKLLDWCDLVAVVGQPGEASVEALGEATLRRGKPALSIADPSKFEPNQLAGARRIALTAGAFALDDTIRSIHAVIKACGA